MQPQYVEAHSAKVLFVRIDPAEWKLPGDNQRVLNSVFKVTRIIYVVRFEWNYILKILNINIWPLNSTYTSLSKKISSIMEYP